MVVHVISFSRSMICLDLHNGNDVEMMWTRRTVSYLYQFLVRLFSQHYGTAEVSRAATKVHQSLKVS